MKRELSNPKYMKHSHGTDGNIAKDSKDCKDGQDSHGSRKSQDSRERIILTEYTIPAGLPEQISLALVTDLHERDPEPVLKLLREGCPNGRPNLIMAAGDTFERYTRRRDNQWEFPESLSARIFRELLMRMDDLAERFSGQKEHDPENAYHFLREAGKIAPLYLSLGNHDRYFLPEDISVIRESGTVLLDNRDTEVRVRDVRLRIGGLSSEPDFDWLDEFSRKDGYKILLCHHPEYYSFLKDRDISLILSGHAHGGQIRIFGRGIYAPGQGVLPKYTRGVYDGRMVVSAGCVNTASVPRWGNHCEVVMIHLK